MMQSQAPEGFKPLPVEDDLFRQYALYTRLRDGAPILGFRVREHHINPFGLCHGGVIAGFADFQAFGVQHLAGLRSFVTPTINLSLDFVAPAKLGMWVEMRIELLRATKSLLFSAAIISGDETLVARTSAVYMVTNAARAPDRPEPIIFG